MNLFQFIIIYLSHNFYIQSVPSCQPDRSNWITAIEQYQPFDYYVQTFHVCSLHFKTNDLLIRGLRRTIAKGAVPSIFGNDNAADNLHQNTELNSNQNQTVEAGSNNNVQCDFSALAFDFYDYDEQEQQDIYCENQSELDSNVEYVYFFFQLS